MKIAVIGYSGAGKSTMARQLGEIYNIEVLYLDRVQFEPNWKERKTETAKAMVEDFMQNNNWIIDGNYIAFYQERRLAEADLIIFFNFSKYICLWQAFRRYRSFKNKTRFDVGSGCIEKMDMKFIKWILFDGRTHKKKKHYDDIIKAYYQKVVVLRSRRQVTKFLMILQTS